MPRKGQKLGKYRRTETISLDRMKRLIQKCPSLDWKALFSLLWLTGCRISEVLSLRKSDFRIEGDYLVVSIQRLKRKDKPLTDIHLPLRSRFCHFIMEYARTRKGQLWSCSRTEAWKMLKSLDARLTLHDFRRHRANFMARKRATVWEMLSFFGWKSTSTPTAYLEKHGGLGRQLSPLLLEEG